MNFLSAFWDALPVEVKGAILAIIMTFCRHYSSDKPKTVKFILLEGLMCSGLTLSIAVGLHVIMHVDLYFSIAIGGLLGYLGPAWFSIKLENYVDKKIDKE